MTVQVALEQVNSAVLDLQQASLNTFDRPLKELSAALRADELRSVAERLKAATDFEAFIESADDGGSMLGSAKLNWPIDLEEKLGLSIAIIDRGAESRDWFMNFAFNYLYISKQVIEDIRHVVRSVIIPFNRDFAAYMKRQTPEVSPRVLDPGDRNRVFIVHGHDDGPREAVARFLERLGLTPIILHEQVSRGRTIPEKLQEYSDVGFAIVLLTPDDEGRAKGGELKPRARQNVILELGYFIGRLGRERVCALLKEDVEMPSDYMGVVYVPFDGAAGGWRLNLARELEGADYQVDWNAVMKT